MKRAILMIHGFMGSPNDQKILADYIEKNSDIDVFSFLLPGHAKGETKEQFDRHLWLEACDNELHKIMAKNYDEIYVFGHSMGGVLAAHLTSCHEVVKKLVLMSPAFHFMGYSEKRVPHLKKMTVFPKLLAMITKDETVKKMLKLPKYYQHQYLDLICERQEVLDNIKVPVLQLAGKRDKLVKLSDSKYVNKRLSSPNKKLIIYKSAKHNPLDSGEVETVCMDILKFLES